MNKPICEILKIKGDWSEVLDDCRATIHKAALGKVPNRDWRRRMLIAEHDPIRDIEVKFAYHLLPYWVAMHFKTHTWRSRCNSQRNDRQADYDRTKAPQDAPVEFIGDCNAQHLIDTSRKRLCFQASTETRQAWEALKVKLAEHDRPLADVMVPNCIYRGGCPEKMQGKDNQCCFFANLAAMDERILSHDIQERYDAYNAFFRHMTREE